MELQGKCVLLGVTGGIAAYKMAGVASALKKQGADVEVIMTRNATQFITPLTFETLTGHKCMVDTFDRDFKFEVTHIELAKKADVILVAPATANVIAKMAHGIADDMLTTTVLAAGCPKLVSPAMNTGMLENPITQDNIRTLERYGFTVIPSESRAAGGRHGRPHPGGHRPGPLPDQPLHRQDGLRGGPRRRPAGGGGHPDPWPHRAGAAAVCAGCTGHLGAGDVRGGDRLLCRNRHSGHGGGGGRLPPRLGGGRQGQEVGPPPTFWAPSARPRPTSSSAASRWRRGTWWPTRPKSSAARIWI